jgi:murein DD-endopeptidase MepM/ murein hydrolase activator NlpD
MMRGAFPGAAALLLATAGIAQVPADQATEHVVEEGETLGGIANRAKVPRVLIAEANGLKEPYTIRVGQKLKIPRTRRHTVEAGETGFGIAYQYAVPWSAIAVANGMGPDDPVRTGTVLLIPTVLDPPPAPTATATATASSPKFAWPVTGPVRRGFRPRSGSNHHDGYDIKASNGTAVRATAAGKVIFAGEKGDYGNLVVIDHGDGWHSAYGFMSRITVVRNEQVNQGERIGLVGSTGLAKGNELHFELRRNNAPVDPKGELPEGP